MDARVTAAVIAGKGAALASRAAGRGGTALPGLVAERLHPGLLAALGRQLGGGSVLITGTNGKTTAARMTASILDAAGVPFVHNREGSNLTRGIASALLARSDVRGRLQLPADAVGLFETDEATLPRATELLRPRALVFTNLFRDQLDRYGEVESVAALWREALARAPEDATLVLCADDPSVAELALDWLGPLHWFGIDDPAMAVGEATVADARWCRVCGSDYAYERRFFAHIGHWFCPGCGRRRAEPDTAALALSLGLEAAAFEVPGLGRVRMRLTGLYNVWNALAAAALARVLGVSGEAIIRGLGRAAPAFGRQERIDVEGRRLRLFLTKNPAGANQVLHLLANAGEALAVACLLNDRFADGQDVSWVWDVEYELLTGKVARCWAGGDRAEDMALRLVYAGWPPPGVVPRSPGGLLDTILAGTEPGMDVFVLATYTAMLDFRALLTERGYVGTWW